MNVKMLSLTATPMLLWALVASASDVVTVTLVGGGRVTAPLLRQSEEGVVLDLGYDVLQIPAKRLLDVRREDEATGEPARAAVDRGIFRTGRLESREVPALVKRFGEAVVMVKTPGGLGTGFLVSREGHLITNYHVVEKQTQLRVTMFREVAAKGAAGTAAKTPPASGQGTGFEKIEFRKVKIIALQPLRDFGPRAAAEEAPASVSRSIRAEPQAAKSRHGTRDRQRQQATRSHDRRRWERRSRDGGLL